MIPFVFLLIGAVFVVAGVRGQAQQVGEILKSDFTGQPNYLTWIIAVAAVGLLLTNSYTEKVGTAFFALLLVVLFLSNRGFFAEFSAQTLR
jgi:hypothetical protein